MGFNLDDSNIFLLWLTSGSNGFVSAYFNMTNATTSSSTSSASSSSTITSVSSSLSPSSQQNSSAASSQGQGSSDGSLNTAAKIGLGVGLGIGIPLLVAFGVVIGLLLRKSRAPEPSTNPPAKDTQPYYYNETIEQPYQYAPYEAPDAALMPGQSLNPSELDGTSKSASELGV
jgi:hypothetical protein